MLNYIKNKQAIRRKIWFSGLVLALMGTSSLLNAATTVPDFNQYNTVLEKKKAFFSYLLPEINKQNKYLLAQRVAVFEIQKKILQQQPLSVAEGLELESLRITYNIGEDVSVSNGLDELIKRVDVVPLDLALVQAANESAWGTSRFAKQGYNFFGVWCFSKGCGFVPHRRESGDTHEVAKFNDLSHGVMAYMQNLNSNKAYAEMWEIRYQQRLAEQPISGKDLLPGLQYYSQRGFEYVNELLSMLHVNKKHMSI